MAPTGLRISGLSDLGTETITRLRAPLVTDTRDNSVSQDWDNATSFDIEGCLVEPFRMSVGSKNISEDMEGRMWTKQVFRIFVPPDSDFVFTDRLIWRGIQMDVLGSVALWVDFEGNEDHIQFLGLERLG